MTAAGNPYRFNVTVTDTAAPLTTALPGTVDELAIYPTALSADRISAHWSAGAASVNCAPAPASAYATAVLADNPVAYYKLDEASGNRVAFDSSGHCRNGARAVGSTKVAGALAGDTEGALSMTTAAPGLAASSSGLPAAGGSRSVELWVKASSGVCGGFGGLVGYDAVVLRALNTCGHDGELQLLVGETVVASVPGQMQVIGDDSWHQIGYTYDAASQAVVLYVDGVAVGAASNVTVTDTAAPLTTALPGTVDELAIYPTALSADQLSAHYLRASAIFGSGRIAGNVTYAGAAVASATIEACNAAHLCGRTTTSVTGSYALALSIHGDL